MAQDTSLPGDRPAAHVCPWCSAALTDDATNCPSCGANLTADGEPVVPGLTAVDAEALLRSKAATTQQRSRLMSWISGEYANDTPSATESQAVAPPDVEVRREMLRLQLEAEVANLQAEADAILSEAAVEGRVVDIPEGLRPYAPDAVEVLEHAEGIEATGVETPAAAEAVDIGPEAASTDAASTEAASSASADGPSADAPPAKTKTKR